MKPLNVYIKKEFTFIIHKSLLIYIIFGYFFGKFHSKIGTVLNSLEFAAHCLNTC